MKEELTLRLWLDTPCKPGEVSTLDGAFYLPIAVVLEKLAYMRDRYKVNIKMHSISHQYHRLPTDTVCSGNMVIDFKDGAGFEISVPCAASILLSHYPNNHHYAEIVKSLNIVNGCKMLGKQFGSHLNEMIDVEAQKSGRQKPLADELIKARYKLAVEKSDEQTIKTIEDNYVGYN